MKYTIKDWFTILITRKIKICQHCGTYHKRKHIATLTKGHIGNIQLCISCMTLEQLGYNFKVFPIKKL